MVIEADEILPRVSRCFCDSCKRTGNATTPEEDGIKLADALLAIPDWTGVRLVLRHLHTDRLISSVFLSLFRRVMWMAPTRYGELSKVEFDARHAFQRESIHRWIDEINEWSRYPPDGVPAGAQ